MSEHRHAIVTGGSSGLGAAVVDLLIERGDRVAVLDRNKPLADGAEYLEVDLADGRAAEQAVGEARLALAGPIDTVVTAAGMDACGTLRDVPAALWERVVAVNLMGTVAVVRATLPDLERTAGRVVLVASTLGWRALPDATAYCASKFGVVGFARALAAECRGRPGVTCLLPGGMATAFFDGRPEQYKPGPDASLNDPARSPTPSSSLSTSRPDARCAELLICPSEETSWP